MMHHEGTCGPVVVNGPNPELERAAWESTRMRIAVVGSWKDREAEHWRLTGSEGEFGETCRLLGSEIVRLGHSLIVAGELGLLGNPGRGGWYVGRS